MPIPDLDADGLLPDGVHDCTLEELRDRFGTFQTSDQRCRLYERLEQFVREAKLSGIVNYVIRGRQLRDRQSGSGRYRPDSSWCPKATILTRSWGAGV